MNKPYRFNIGVALFDRSGRILLGRSMSDGPEFVLPGAEWQMPQGGIDPEEDIVEAARRELQEETGVVQAQFLSVTSQWWAYDFHPSPATGHRLEVYAGQQQRWAAFRFTGVDAEIDLTSTGAGFYPEFTEWRWATLQEAVAGVIFYKRANYEKMAAAFAGYGIAAS